MMKKNPPSMSSYHGSAAFSLVELMIVVAIIIFLVSLSLIYSRSELQGEKINSVANGIAGWLEQIRTNSLKQTSTADVNAGGCVVCLADSNASPPTDPATSNCAGTSSLSASQGSSIAFTGTACSNPVRFLMPGLIGQYDSFTVSISDGTSAKSGSSASIVFTPRGSITQTSDTIIKIFFPQAQQMRCVRITAVSGLIRIGAKTGISTSVNDECDNYSRFQ